MSIRIRLLVVALPATLCGVDSIAAQPVSMGSTVRITREGEALPVVGVLERATGTEWTLNLSDGRSVQVPLTQIGQAEVREQRRNTLRGLLIGGAVGVVGGLLLAASVEDDCDPDTTGLCDAVVGGAVQGPVLILTPLLGAGAGALIGSMVTSSRWVPVILPGAGTPGITVGWSFRPPGRPPSSDGSWP